jgi:hypothetical protein
MLPPGFSAPRGKAPCCGEALSCHKLAPILVAMARVKGIEGTTVQADTPNWLPLALVAGIDLLEDFMWMFEVQLSDERRLHAYKHVDTRRYLHLDDEANAFFYDEDGRYRPIELWRILHAVLSPLWRDGLSCAPGAVARARRALDLVHCREEDADTIPRR